MLACSVSMRVPNLFLHEPPMMAERLYARLWTELRRRERWDDIVHACRRIRGYWARSLRRESPRYLIGWEIDALIALGSPEVALRQYRRWLATAPRRHRQVRARLEAHSRRTEGFRRQLDEKWARYFGSLRP